ncbi:MAG: SDR family oxidoreductase [Bacteroidales bacterium]|nr:SDR family oxidoreductase [Bacteroidales bacterium]
MKNILVIGGANGIGLSLAKTLCERQDTKTVYVVDKSKWDDTIFSSEKVQSFVFDLTNEDYSFFNRFTDIDSLIITAGFGRLALFKDISDKEIQNYFAVNTLPAIRLIRLFYDKLLSKEDFFCSVMVSIAGYMSSPFFSVYGATKAALKIFIESVNVELEKSGATNRILNVSPGSIKGTSFNGEKTDISLTSSLANDIINNMLQKNDVLIPQYEEVFKHVLERYHEDFRKEGLHSYDYKLNSGRVK